jgi:hypothetical protein
MNDEKASISTKTINSVEDEDSGGARFYRIGIHCKKNLNVYIYIYMNYIIFQ